MISDSPETTGASLSLNNQSIISDQWTDNGDISSKWETGAAQTLTVSQTGSAPETASINGATVPLPLPINVQYYQNQGAARVYLLVENGGNTSTGQPVPASWFTKAPRFLPSGWANSTPILGSAGEYVKAESHEGYVVLTDSGGATHTFTKSSSGGYTSPVEDLGMLSSDQTGALSYADKSGTIYLFDAAGDVNSVTPAVDQGAKPATPIPDYASTSTLSGALRAISDPVSASSATPITYSRQISFGYSTDTAAAVGLTGTGTACPAVSGFSSAPAGDICVAVYPDGSKSQYLYDSNGQLARIVDPGSSITSFGYTLVAGQYRLASIQSPTTYDWLQAHPTVSKTGPVNTTISYDTSGRATAVTMPAPDGVTSGLRPAKSFTYVTAPTSSVAGKTYVDVTGVTAPNTGGGDGHDETVTFNQNLQKLTDMSASGLITTTAWNTYDKQIASIDPQGHETSLIYDSQNRLVDSYGPAPSSCFVALVPNEWNGPPLAQSCAVTPAESTTSYDSGLRGLSATWFNNETLSGVPVALGLGVGTADGSLNQGWSSSPLAGVNATNYSANFTGTIQFPSTGSYTITAASDDGVQVWIDNKLTVNHWNFGTGSGTLSITNPKSTSGGQISTIRVAMHNTLGPGSISLSWTPPGSSTASLVPGTALAPNYGLATRTSVVDSVPSGISGITSSQVGTQNTSTTYASPWLGIQTSSSVDPAGLNLTTTATSESAGSGYLRQLTTTKPAGSATTVTNAYYSPTETYGSALGITTPVCGLPISTIQYGSVKTTTRPAPAGGTAQVTTYIHDLFGRVVGTKPAGDTGWTCTTIDARGRTSSISYPAFGTSSPARTATYSFTSDNTPTGDPLVSWEQDGSVAASPNGSRITTATDLDGRQTSYTDIWGTVTSTGYNLANQLTSSTATPPGGTAQTQTFVYNVDGQQVQTARNGVLATTTYTNGVMSSVNYPSGSGNSGNGTSLAATYAATGVEHRALNAVRNWSADGERC